jgi:hypothetical protein
MSLTELSKQAQDKLILGSAIPINKLKKMIESLSNKQFQELFKKLPENLQDAIFAPETVEHIDGICERNKTPELTNFMINGIGDVYLGVLAPNDFFTELEKQLEGKTGYRQVALEVNNFLLFPYKDSIEKIYHTQTPAPAAAATTAETPTQEDAAASATATPVGQDAPPEKK